MSQNFLFRDKIKQPQEDAIIFHDSNERGLIRTCDKCQATPHYCVVLNCNPETAGCLDYYFLSDLKTLRWSLPFTWEKLYSNHMGESNQ
jgi:hypothetical protein